MVWCEAERDRRADERVELLGGAFAHLERDVDVRPERPMVAVIFCRADRHEDRAAAALQVLAHLEVRHLRHVALHPRPSLFRCSRDPRIAAFTSASGGHGSPLNSISTEYGPVVARVLEDPKDSREVDVAGADLAEVPDALPALGLLQMDVHELVDDLRQVLDRGVAGVVDDVRRVVVDPDGVAPDLLEQRERDRRPRP